MTSEEMEIKLQEAQQLLNDLLRLRYPIRITNIVRYRHIISGEMYRKVKKFLDSCKPLYCPTCGQKIIIKEEGDE